MNNCLTEGKNKKFSKGNVYTHVKQGKNRLNMIKNKINTKIVRKFGR